MVQQIPLTLTISCSSKSRLVLPPWFYLSGTCSPGWSQTNSRTAVKRLCVCIRKANCKPSIESNKHDRMQFRWWHVNEPRKRETTASMISYNRSNWKLKYINSKKHSKHKLNYHLPQSTSMPSLCRTTKDNHKKSTRLTQFQTVSSQVIWEEPHSHPSCTEWTRPLRVLLSVQCPLQTSLLT